MDTFCKGSSGVYAIVNLANGKLYVGSSCDLKRRKGEHLFDLRNGYHYIAYLQNSWNKYGPESFEFIELELCNESDLIAREQYWLDHFQSYLFENGYNQSPTAGSCIGFKHSEETLRKMSESKMGIPMPDWVKEKIRAALTGKNKSAEHRANLWKNRKGWRHSEESKAKTSASVRKAVENGARLGPPEGWHPSEEVRLKISKAGKGKPKSAEHRLRLSLALKGRIRSSSHCRNISIAKRKKYERRKRAACQDVG